MASEGNRLVVRQRQASEGDRADDGGSSLVGEDTRLLTARIAQKLQNTGLACEVFNLVPTDKAVLSRDRIEPGMRADPTLPFDLGYGLQLVGVSSNPIRRARAALLSRLNFKLE